MKNMDGKPPSEGSVRFTRLVRRRLRWYRRILAATLLTLYIVSGMLMLMPNELSAVQCGLHIAIGIATGWRNQVPPLPDQWPGRSDGIALPVDGLIIGREGYEDSCLNHRRRAIPR